MSKIDPKLIQIKELINLKEFDQVASVMHDTTHEFLDDYDQLRLTLDEAITQSSNQSARSDPPHPATISLIRLRRKLPI